MTFKQNLPIDLIKSAVTSCEISDEIEYNLKNLGIDILKLNGRMNCDDAVKNHPDLYIVNCLPSEFIFAKNMCSIEGGLPPSFKGIEIETSNNKIEYPFDVFFNVAFVGNTAIGNKKHIHSSLLEIIEKNNISFIDVNQGYAKCNISIVDEKSVITEDFGIYRKLSEYGFDVLLLEHHGVSLKGYKYGFIGGASGKIAVDKLAFYGDITLHPEYDSIKRFLYRKNVEPVSLSSECMVDLGSLLPIF